MEYCPQSKYVLRDAAPPAGTASPRQLLVTSNLVSGQIQSKPLGGKVHLHRTAIENTFLFFKSGTLTKSMQHVCIRTYIQPFYPTCEVQSGVT